MKIYDIISESRLTEAPGAPIIGEFVNAALKTFAWTLGRGPRTKAAEELARVWAAEMIAAGKPTIKLGTKTAEQVSADILTAAKLDPVLAADKAIREEGFNAAKKIYLEAERKGLLKDIGQGVGKVVTAVGKVTAPLAKAGKWITYALTPWQAMNAWEEFSKEQDTLKAELESGKINEAQYLKDTRSDWAVFIGKVVVAVAGTIVVILPVTLGTQAALKAAFISKLRKTGPWTATFTHMIETATPAGMAAFVAYLNSESGTKHFVDWLTSAGGKWKGVDGIIEWATSPSQFLDVAGGILQGGAGNTRPAQSGQQPAQPAQSVGTTPSGATVSGDWK